VVPPNENEPTDETAAASDIDLAEVNRRLEQLRHRKRGRVRWDVGKHTAELAIRAITGERKRSRKTRRQRRHKKLL
jgi:hypothetical protein